MAKSKVENLLVRVSEISKKYDEIAKLTGENFNIFSVMGMEWDEVYTHSAIIGELLNSKGSHGQGSLFLDLFVEQIKEKFSKEDCHLELNKFEDLVNERICERTIGNSVDLLTATGGRIDIIIEDKNQILIIENKPGFQDQPLQLVRYYNYAKNRGKTFFVFYLTTDGRELKDETYHIDLENGEKAVVKGINFPYDKKSDYEDFKPENLNTHCCLYYPISFGEDIINWVEQCLIRTILLPKIREVLVQYLETLKRITNQITNDKMKEEIKDLITPENAELIPQLWTAMVELIEEIKNTFLEELNLKLKARRVTGCNDDYILPEAGFDDEGFYITYVYYDKKENNISHLTKNAKIYFVELKKINNELSNKTSGFAWYSPAGFLKSKKFSLEEGLLKEKIKLNIVNLREVFIEEILDEELKLNVALKKMINKEN